MWIAGAAFLACFVVFAVRDPRRMRCAVFLLAGLLSLGLALVDLTLRRIPEESLGVYAVAVISSLYAFVLVIIVLAVMLILNGLTMMRREGRRPANLLGLLLGAGMLVYVVWSVWALAGNRQGVFVWVLLAGIPLSYLGFGFSAYIVYSLSYLAVTKRRSRTPPVVAILGSGLINGQVTRLLASRLDRGMAVAGDDATIVVCGGKGTDEARSEASAMTEYLVDRGVDESRIIREDRSTTTEENLVNMKGLLEVAGLRGPVATVSNTFHAFRAALLMSRHKIAGYAVGSPTARYYWPAATIREYVAIMRDSLILNVVFLTLSVLPLVIRVITTIWGQF